MSNKSKIITGTPKRHKKESEPEIKQAWKKYIPIQHCIIIKSFPYNR